MSSISGIEGLKKIRTYGNWRRPVSPGILGLGSVGTILLMAGLVAIVITTMIRGLFEALVVGGILGVVLLTFLVKDVHGKNMLARMSSRVSWTISRKRGTNIYRSGPLGHTPWGTFQLPGIVAPTRLSEHEDSYGRKFALLYTPATGSYSICIGTEPDGAALVDEEQIDVWVASWGQWLANLADEPGVEAASVTIETAPDSGTRLRREVTMNTDEQAPVFAKEMLADVISMYPKGSSTVRAYITLTFSAALRVGGKKRLAQEVGHDLAARLPGLTASLQATGAGAAHALSAQELCEVIRVAYDPAAAVLIDEARALGNVPELRWSEVGPSAAEASWDGYRHDSAFSCTWSMTGAPRGIVQARILSKLLAPHRDIARKRVSLLYRPIDSALAASIVEADVNAANFRSTSSAKPAARDILASRAAKATADEEAKGAGLVQFGVLISATVTDSSKRMDAKAAIDNLSATARLRIRPVYGSQDSAFAACLPLGLVLPKHIKIPAELREKL